MYGQMYIHGGIRVSHPVCLSVLCWRAPLECLFVFVYVYAKDTHTAGQPAGRPKE
jgi:hypothetical protein